MSYPNSYRIAVIILAVAAASFAPSLSRADAPNGDKLAGIPRAEYRARRQKLMEQVKDGLVVLVGAREDEFGEVGRFRQKNDFMYLTGVETPAAYLMLTPAGLVPNQSARETVFMPPRNPGLERWNGAQMGPGPEAEKHFGVERDGKLGAVREPPERAAELARLQARPRRQ